MPSITLRYRTFTDASGQVTFHMALIVNSPDASFIVQSDENGKLSSNNTTEISREYAFTQDFEILPRHFAVVLRFIHNLRTEISKNQANHKCGAYVLFLLQLARLFPYKKSDFPTEIPAEIADYLYTGTNWNPDINALTEFAATIDKEFTPELMVKLSKTLSQKSEAVAEPEPRPEAKPDIKSQPEPESDTSKKIKLFKRMYKMLRHGESSFFKKDFLADKADLVDSELENEIGKAHPDSQAKLAWDLAQRYFYLYGWNAGPKNGNTFDMQKSQSQLFFSLIKNEQATTVIVSVHDKYSRQNKILFTIGIIPIPSSGQGYCAGYLYSEPGTLAEYYDAYTKLRKVTYQSFEITTEQYNELLEHVATNVNIDDLFPPSSTASEPPKLKTSHIPGAYRPYQPPPVDGQAKVEDEKQPSHFKYGDIIQVRGKTKEQTATGLNPNSPYNKYNVIQHNCRDTGIELFDVTFKQQLGKKLFSSNCFTDFPYTGLIYNGEFIGHHYILPAPPNKDTLQPKLYKILARLYKRLEEIPKLKPDSQLTMDKFNALKDLYHSLAPAQPLRLEQLLTVINTWESTGENKKIIDTHRGIKFFPNTSTRNSITELKTLATPSCSWFGCS